MTTGGWSPVPGFRFPGRGWWYERNRAGGGRRAGRAGVGALHPGARAGQGRGRSRGNALWLTITGNLSSIPHYAIITY